MLRLKSDDRSVANTCRIAPPMIEPMPLSSPVQALYCDRYSVLFSPDTMLTKSSRPDPMDQPVLAIPWIKEMASAVGKLAGEPRGMMNHRTGSTPVMSSPVSEIGLLP